MAPETTLADVERAKAKTEQLIARIHGARTTQELREIWRGEVQPFLVSPLMFERGLDSLLQYLTEARDKRQAELSKLYVEESTARWYADSENRKRRELEESKRLSRRRESNFGTTADVVGSPGWFGESQRHSEAAIKGAGGVVAPVERPPEKDPYMDRLHEAVRKKFLGRSTKQIIQRMERAPDFGYDDEETELSRRGVKWRWVEKIGSKPRIEIISQ